MGRKKYTDNPAVDDTIIFDLNTENDDGMPADPFSVEKVTIFYLEKRVNDNSKKIEKKFYNPDLQKQYEEWKQITDADSSLENISTLKNIKKKLDSTAKITDVYYKEAQFVMSTLGPIWTKDGSVRKVVNFTDKNKKPIPGMFFFAWMPTDMREGDYIIRWEWRVEEHGKIKAAEKIFSISPSTKINATNVNLVPRDKYDFLLKKYIPAMYFVKTKPDDLTPNILEKLNKTVGQCFLEIEDMVSNLFTLADTESIKADFLPLLANNFGLILRSESTDAWRNQIRFASRLYKKKGTYEGLRQALDKAGITLLKLTNLWQVVSKCNWMDGFLIDRDVNLDTQIIGYLTRKPIGDDVTVDIKSGDEYISLPKGIITFQEVQAPETKTAIVWQGGNIDPQIPLIKGDLLRIKYKYNNISENDATIEKYIEELSLSDQRDELKIKYPLKNWNIRLIEEDDPLFSLLVTERNPFYSPVVFGKIRTTFLYSEKVFNMDTYNGSLYNSNNPCDIDKDFVDTCNGGRSSKFNVYLEFDQVTDDKIKEAREIIVDYSPFHTILHNIIISSRISDYVLPPVESIKNDIKEDKNKEKISFGEAINCKIKYKDGRELEGTI